MARGLVRLLTRLGHPATGPWGGARLGHPATGPCAGARLGHPQPHARAIHASHANMLKEIVEEEEEDTLTVEGHYITSPNTRLLVKCGEEAGHACPLCALDLDVKHTDVLILSQFMKSNGGILPRRVTGLCAPQQRRLTWIIIMSQKAGLMPNLAPANSKRDPRRRYGSKKFNRYFDENTLPK